MVQDPAVPAPKWPLVRRHDANRSIREVAPVGIYLNDLYDIEGCLVSDGAGLSIYADGYMAGSVADLKSLPHKRVKTVEFRTVTPQVVVRFSSNSILLMGPTDDPGAARMLNGISELLAGRRRRVAAFVDGALSLWLILLIIGGFLPGLLVYTRNHPQTSDLVSLVIAGVTGLNFLGMLGSLYYAWVNRVSRAVIYACMPEDRTFWQRNRDRIVLGLLMAIASALLAAAGTVVG